nr:PilN domain-containing protein [Photobacterium galatheae]
MKAVNLLPWRAERQAAHRRRFLGLLSGAVVLALVAVGGMFFDGNQQFRKQQNQYAQLQQQILVLAPSLAAVSEAQGLSELYRNRLRQISDWHHARFPLIHLLNHLPDVFPEAIRLEALTLHQDQVRLRGLTQDASALSLLLTRMGSANWLSHSQLHTVDRVAQPLPRHVPGGSQRFTFTLTLAPVHSRTAND